jgi:peptidoglycan/xylan/chitin deacetylase (PgdA/CDA1 family)
MPTTATLTAAAAVYWKVPVAMYHIITPKAPDTALVGLFVRTSEFDAQLKAAAAKGIRTITAHDLNASIAARVAIPSKVMVLSFDDGRVELFNYAWPIMQKYGTSLMFDGTKWAARDINADGVADKGYIGSFFIIVGRISSQYLTFDQDAILAKAGNEISNHTNSHVNVATYHGSGLFAQIVTAGHKIETQLAKRGVATPDTTFVYPYGDTSTEAVNLLRANDYGMAFTTVMGIAHSGQNRLLLPRVRVNRGESATTFLKAMGF